MSAEWFRETVTIDGLATRSVRSGATAVGARLAQLVVQIGAVMLLARILTPADFGVHAMVLPIAFLVNGITHQAIQSAVLQQDALQPDDASALFYATLPVNVAIIMLMALAGPLLAWLYSEPRVMLVTFAWAAVILVVTLSSVSEALLKRQHRFGAVARAQLSSHAVSVTVAVVAALLGAGYWALLLQVAILELGRTAQVFSMVRWWPARRPPSERSRAMRGYWLSLMGARAVSWVGDQSDRVVVGALGTTAVAGLYDAAKRWSFLPFVELFIPLTDVAVASLGRVHREAERFRVYVRYAIMSVVAVTYPIFAFLFVEAELVLRVILGPQWTASAPYMRLLAVAIVAVTLIRLMQWVYLATGATRRQLGWSFVTTPLILAGVLAGGLLAGPRGVAIGLAVAAWVLVVPSARNAIRGTPLTLGDTVGVALRPFLAAALAALLLFGLDRWLPAAPAIVGLLVRGTVFSAGYLAAWLVLPGGARTLRDWRGTAQRALADWRAEGRRVPAAAAEAAE